MRPGQPVPTSAVLLILGSVLCFALLDTIVKHLAPSYPVPLLVFARIGFQFLAMLLWLGPRMGRGLLRTARPRLQIARGLLLLLSALLFMTALKFLPLAEATAINYSSPIVVVLLAVLFLEERMSRARMAFVICGVAGMLLIVRPGTEIFRGAALLPMAAACVYATYQILTRKVADDDPRVTLFYPALVGTLLMAIALPFLDIQGNLPLPVIVLLLAAGLLGTVAHLCFILAFQKAPASALTPYTYMQLVWATLLGWVAFDQFPDAWTMAGMAVIAGSGLLITLHERRRQRLPAAEPAAVD